MRSARRLLSALGTRSPLAVRAAPAVLVALSALAVASPLPAQQVDEERAPLVGTVVDAERGTPLVGAFVYNTGPETGATTDRQGRFRLSDAVAAEGLTRVSLTVEVLGYRTLRWSGQAEAGRPLQLRMTAKPLLLEGLDVVVDRFERRRRAVATPVRAFEREHLATAPHATVTDFIRARTGVMLRDCGGELCIRRRGRMVQPTVYIDEMRVLGGLDFLYGYHPSDLYMVEVYGRGLQIRAYTLQFMESAASRRLMPVPMIW